MKNILYLCLLFFVGCQGSSTSQQQPISTSPTTSTDVKNEVPNRSSVFTAAQLSEVEEPQLSGPAKITASIAGAQQGVAKLIGRYVDQTYVVDSTQVDAKGNFTFSKKEGYPMGQYYAVFNNNAVSFVFFLGEDQEFSIIGNADNLNGTLTFDGSKDNSAFLERIKYAGIMNPKFNDINAKLANATEGSPEHKMLSDQQAKNSAEWKGYLNEIYTKYANTLYVKYTKATQNPTLNTEISREKAAVQYRKEYWDDVDLMDRRLLRTDVIENKLNNYFDKLTPQIHDSIYKSAAILLNRKQHPEYTKFLTNYIMFKYDPKETTLMDPQYVYVNMVQKHYSKEQAFWMDTMQIYSIQRRAHEMSNSLMGQKGPDVIANDQFGKPQSIYEKTADYIIVYMYAPSCEHCQEQTPKLVSWYNEWKNKGVDVYAIALDTDDKEWKDYIAKTGMKFTNVYDSTNKSIYAKYFVDVTPELYVLNPERKIIGKNLKVNQIEIVINRDKEKRK